ncbi:TetR/AcrR family transcriptional regulator [Thioclava sp. BHET1]|nr:TetR/AcrR family transcriptional regulator [Thioclava sp. BHET1]
MTKEKTKRTQKVTRVNGDQTREKILNAAETLFGERGFEGVSLRDITGEASVTLALASYHFGSKENLFEEVVARRAADLSKERLARLAALATPDTRALLDAFMSPLFEKAATGDPGWVAYLRLLSRLGEGDKWLPLLEKYFDDTGQVFLARLGEATTGANPDTLARGFAMALHVMLATASQNGRVTTLTGGKVAANDMDAAYPALLDFCAAGLVAMVKFR